MKPKEIQHLLFIGTEIVRRFEKILGVFLKNIPILDKLIATGTQYMKHNVSRYNSAIYECVARNGIEPDPSRLFKVNIQCKLFYNLNNN